MMELTGKIAVITGAARGIGKAIARGYAESGAKVVIGDVLVEQGRETVEEIKRSGAEAVFVKTDVTNRADVENMVGHALDNFGGLDILVNNAGVYIGAPLLEISEEDWDRQFNVNMKGCFFCSQAGARQMIAQGRGGKIINLASTVGLMGECNCGAYCATKGGIVTFTKVLAAELARYKINANALAPGAIETDISGYSEDDRSRIKARVPWAEIGTPQDVVGAAVYLASDASRYVTGTVLVIDGGWISDATFKQE